MDPLQWQCFLRDLTNLSGKFSVRKGQREVIYILISSLRLFCNSLSLSVFYFSDFELYTSYEFAYNGGCATVSELYPSIIKTENTETVYQCYQFCKVTQQCAYFEYVTGGAVTVPYNAIPSQEGRIY